MEWLNFRHLYSFWSVCRYGGFQKASNKILVSQSAISDQVSQLEDYLGEKLLERTTRSLKITPVGSDLLKYADDIFSKSTEINHIIRDKNDLSPNRQIRIGIVGGISRNFIFRMIIQNMIENEQANMTIIDGSFQELSEMLKSLDVDLVFSLEIPRKKDLMDMVFRKVKSSPLCLAGRPTLIKKVKAKRKAAIDMSVFMFNHHYDKDVISDVLQPRFQINPTIPVTTDDISLLRFMANSGRGVAVVPEIGVQEDLDTGQLSRILLDELNPVDFYAISLKKTFHQNLIDDFLA